MTRNSRCWAAAIAVFFLSGAVRAQTTDGYHIVQVVQVVPLVVESASFTQQFNFHTPSLNAVIVHSRFFPG